MKIGVEHRVSVGRVAAIIALAVVAAVVAIWLGGKPAEAAFPGKNGRIAFVSDRDGDTEIYSMNSNGTGVKNLTNNAAGEWMCAASPEARG